MMLTMIETRGGYTIRAGAYNAFYDKTGRGRISVYADGRHIADFPCAGGRDGARGKRRGWLADRR